jgi:mycothiol synthase
MRAFDPSRDWPAAAELLTTAHLHDGVDWIPTPEILKHDWTTVANFLPARDIRVVEDAEGRLSALVNMDWRERDGRLISHMVELWVRPDRRRQGLGTTLLEWAEGHARELSLSGQAGRLDWPHVIGGWGDTVVPGHAQLAARHGYAPYRYGYEMHRQVAEPVGEFPLPDGLEVRPVEPAHHRAIWDADIEAFLDHPEPATRTEEDFQGWFTEPDLDTSLYQVAWDGDQVAGSVLTSIHPQENERLGVRRAWLDHISIRRPWRKRGLAASLIASTLRLLAERGIEDAALGVDAENPSGALRLYEKLGFRKHREGVGYRKALEL